MKTNYHLKSKNHNKPGRRIVLLLIFFVLGAGFFSFFGKYTIGLMEPVWRSQNVVVRGISNSFEWLRSKDSLIKENAYLREVVASRELELVALRAAADRELRLLEILGRTEGREGTLASVLVRPPETPYDVLIIDAGTNQGIVAGQQVILPEGTIIGVVSEAYRSSSRVILHSASGQKINAVLERNGAPIIMEGRGGGNFRITLPRDMAVEVGDRILSADISSSLLAVVGKVSLGPTDSFKEVLATSPANIFSLRFVLVLP
jgi:cell shape-determining protein MreC